MIPYGKQNIDNDDISAVIEVLKSTYLTQGPAVPRFESEICKKVNAGFAIATNSATSALHIACLALGVGKQSRVWTSPISFVASANCALYCGATIDFVDINRDDGLLSIDALERKLVSAKKEGILPDVIIPVHLAGNPCAMKEISLLKRKYGFKVIEDASHAIGGSYADEPIGNCRYSDITVFSLHPVKIITTGEGGIALTNDPNTAKKMQLLRSHGITKDRNEFQYLSDAPWIYEQQSLGFNYRMTDIQAALGTSQLKKLEKFVQDRNIILARYREELTKAGVEMLKTGDDSKTSGHLAIMLLPIPDKARHRRIFEKLRESGIGVQLHYIPIHLQPYYRNLGFRKGDFPIAEEYADRAISIPVYPGITIDEQSFVIESISQLLREENAY